MLQAKNKKEYYNSLIELIKEKMQTEHINGEDAICKYLTEKQYDSLIDAGYDIDELLYNTKEEYEEAKQSLKKHLRPHFEKGYSKKYTDEKQLIYNTILQALQDLEGVRVVEPIKINYRNIAIFYKGNEYDLILSKKNNKK